jgi:hypothetical protein
MNKPTQERSCKDGFRRLDATDYSDIFGSMLSKHDFSLIATPD